MLSKAFDPIRVFRRQTADIQNPWLKGIVEKRLFHPYERGSGWALGPPVARELYFVDPGLKLFTTMPGEVMPAG